MVLETRKKFYGDNWFHCVSKSAATCKVAVQNMAMSEPIWWASEQTSDNAGHSVSYPADMPTYARYLKLVSRTVLYSCKDEGFLKGLCSMKKNIASAFHL